VLRPACINHEKKRRKGLRYFTIGREEETLASGGPLLSGRRGGE